MTKEYLEFNPLKVLKKETQLEILNKFIELAKKKYDIAGVRLEDFKCSCAVIDTKIEDLDNQVYSQGELFDKKEMG